MFYAYKIRDLSQQVNRDGEGVVFDDHVIVYKNKLTHDKETLLFTSTHMEIKQRLTCTTTRSGFKHEEVLLFIILFCLETKTIVYHTRTEYETPPIVNDAVVRNIVFDKLKKIKLQKPCTKEELRLFRIPINITDLYHLCKSCEFPDETNKWIMLIESEDSLAERGGGCGYLLGKETFDISLKSYEWLANLLFGTIRTITDLEILEVKQKSTGAGQGATAGAMQVKRQCISLSSVKAVGGAGIDFAKLREEYLSSRLPKPVVRPVDVVVHVDELDDTDDTSDEQESNLAKNSNNLEWI